MKGGLIAMDINKGLKIASLVLSVVSLGFGLVRDQIDGKRMDQFIDLKVAEKVAEALKKGEEAV